MDTVLEQIMEHPMNQKILKAYSLKGKKPQMPTNLDKFHEVYAYRKIEPTIKNMP